MKEKDIESLDHTTWRCQYHVVFAPKHRRLAIYNEIKADIGFILRQVCKQKDVEIIEAEACARTTSIKIMRSANLRGPFRGDVCKTPF